MPIFVVHEHHASHLHWDFRLEIAGVLKSWAIPKGPSMNPDEKRLAILVADHNLDYGDYEGIIPEGMGGAGPVVIWDKGKFEPNDDTDQGLSRGRLSFVLTGEQLHGAFSLVRFRHGKEKEWLLIKKHDRFADPTWQLVEALTPEKRHTLEVKIPPCEDSGQWGRP